MIKDREKRVIHYIIWSGRFPNVVDLVTHVVEDLKDCNSDYYNLCWQYALDFAGVPEDLSFQERLVYYQLMGAVSDDDR